MDFDVNDQKSLFETKKNNSILEFEEIKRFKENVNKSIKEKKETKITKKNNIEGINKQYLNLLYFDKNNDSCFDDDLFFLNEAEYQKINKKTNKLDERRKYRSNKRKLKKKFHKKQLIIKRNKNPFTLSIEEFLETEYNI